MNPAPGHRSPVTVHLSTRRWFNAEVEAASRTQLKEWPAALDAALDAYFEES
ncbi:Lsr2 protein OS=Streptomyces microflavus OX=1919 GN=HUT09_27795 PE=4 SV=1 [Streptomyces microflavus]